SLYPSRNQRPCPSSNRRVPGQVALRIPKKQLSELELIRKQEEEAVKLFKDILNERTRAVLG
ncbi:MAG: hypothetical protein ACXVBB_21295, partial [Isosphaeraceae bacterium]